MMRFTNEIIEKAKTAKSAEELLELAKAENIELSAEQAEKAFAELNRTGELSDEELDNVAGGCGGLPSSYPSSGACEAESKVEFCYNIGDRVSVKGMEFPTMGLATILDRRAGMNGGYWYPYSHRRYSGCHLGKSKVFEEAIIEPKSLINN